MFLGDAFIQICYFLRFKFLFVKLRFLSILALSFFAVQISVAQTEGKWTLEKCIDYALSNNIVVRQSALVAKGAANDALQSKLNLLPSVDASANYNFNFGNSLNPVTFQFAETNSQTGSANLQATLPLFTGLQQIHNIQRTKYDLLASQFDYAAAQNNVALSVSSAFFANSIEQGNYGSARQAAPANGSAKGIDGKQD